MNKSDTKPLLTYAAILSPTGTSKLARKSQSRYGHEPSTWSVCGGALNVTTDPGTDFWRETHYGFIRDSGHFLGVSASDGFTVQIRVRGEFRNLYDQAGLMVRADDRHWVKAGVEFTDGQAYFSAVVTNEKSDWSLGQAIATSDFFVRITLAKESIRVQTSTDGKSWPLLRLAPFPTSEACMVGPMTCSPEGGHLVVQFSEFSITPAKTTGLHDLS
ncbi:DUF1349 domain-containing protein [Rhizobiales bacterium RZME27]|uniref:DUF1349 domain-containing protein n=1 Tax=Endobacterium cereale TaxID=2663029 RepID=A0A6A8A9K2_9HYPH|nr:DUF1349 domain-containing protein [Endobacterium cereale]MEB2846736.1 DUF1349 domain-containing protein [Endobacterium cereale]MQY46547.1 DUF1349 domain-containing protein [Endobacterium cereale]